MSATEAVMDEGTGSIWAALVGVLAATLAWLRSRAKTEDRRAQQEGLLLSNVLERVTTLESDVRGQRDRADDLQQQLTLAKQEAARLRWSYDELQQAFAQQGKSLNRARHRIDELEADLRLARERAEAADRRAESLAVELHELYREVAGKTSPGVKT